MRTFRLENHGDTQVLSVGYIDALDGHNRPFVTRSNTKGGLTKSVGRSRDIYVEKTSRTGHEVYQFIGCFVGKVVSRKRLCKF